jgi:uncharacterized protein YpuA (DUF1002 family)
MEGSGVSTTGEEEDPHLLKSELDKSFFNCLEDIEDESKIYQLALNDINKIILSEEIEEEDIDELVKKLNSYSPPITKLTELASTQIATYKRALKDTNQPMNLIRPELERVKEYMESIIQASKTTLNLIKQRQRR